MNKIVNAANKNPTLRKLLDKTLEIHKDAVLPEYASPTLRQLLKQENSTKSKIENAPHKAILFTTCYCNYNDTEVGESLAKVLEHNKVSVELMQKEYCCGMPKLELGDLKSVEKLKQLNIPALYEKAQQGYALIAAVPSCVLMFKQELPLMFPDDPQVQAVAKAFFDPFEFLFKLHKLKQLNTEFKKELGNISYHVACHQRVQGIGPKTKKILQLIPNTQVDSIERCSGHDGTYGVKKETLKYANKIARPIVKKILQQDPDYYGSDCPVAGSHIQHNLNKEHLDKQQKAIHPLALLCLAYQI
ncbi:MAG: hypothetical protein COC19_08385 [SAR86 cluster bacterium]|uniref:Cysteine-rich domain-containing protein n=1 Tax=SAR86 cluster bacterium TaxID=2030880 RepID=A0A2A4MET4_9GAMM|nr:MAG: hypothetical protein COC19_08385 [SAR86 cluster bacterium]